MGLSYYQDVEPMGRFPVGLVNFGTIYGKLLQLSGVLTQGAEAGEGGRAFRKRSIPAVVSHLKNVKGRCIGGQSGPVECFSTLIALGSSDAEFLEGLERAQESTV